MLASSLGAWLSLSESGLRWLWSQLREQPVLAGLQVEGLRGRLIGPIEIDRVSWQLVDGEIMASRLSLDWQPAALWQDTLQLQSVSVERLHWRAAESTDESVAPAEAVGNNPGFAWRWPFPALPLSIGLGRLHIARIELDGEPSVSETMGEVAPAGLWVADLHVSARYAAEGRLDVHSLSLRSPWAELIDAKGDGSADAPWVLRVRTATPQASEWTLSATASQQALAFRLSDAVGQGEMDVHWSSSALDIKLRADRFDLQRLRIEQDSPLTANLALNSDFQQLMVEGDAELGELALDHLNAVLSWENDLSQVQIDTLAWQLAGGGQGKASGAVHGLQQTPELDIKWSISDLPLTLGVDGTSPAGSDAESAPPRLLRAEGVIAGPWQQLRLEGSAELLALERSLSAVWRLHWQAPLIEIERLELLTAHGRADLSGRIELAEQVSTQLKFSSDGLDPFWLSSHWQGELDVQGTLDLQQAADGWSGELKVGQIRGQINAQRFDGRLAVQLRNDQLHAVSAELRAGSGRLAVNTEERALRLSVDQWRLDPWWPDLGGTLDGELSMGDFRQLQQSSPAEWRDLRFDLRGERLQAVGHRLSFAHVHGRWPGPADNGSLDLEYRGLAHPSLGEWRGSISLAGRPEDYSAQLRAERDDLALTLAAAGRHQQGQGRLDLAALGLESQVAGQWLLQAPVEFEYGQTLRLTPACLGGDLGQLCVAMTSAESGRNWTLRGETLQLDRLFALVAPDRGLELRGEFGFDLEVSERDSVWRPGPMRLSGGPGELRSLDQDVQLLGWDVIELRGQKLPDAALWRLDGALRNAAAGSLGLQLELPLGEQPDFSAMRGRVQVDLRQIAALQLLLPDVVGASGTAQGQLSWAMDQQPPLSGELRLTELGGKVPALGVEFADSELTVFGAGNSFNIDGQLRSGGGPLRIEGEWQAGGAARVRLAGRDVRLADTRRLKIVASPDVQISWQQGTARLGGRVEVNEALIDLERIEAGETRSADVVVLDPRFEATGIQALPIQVDLQLQLGEAVRLQGFGFDGRMAGKLRITERPGEAARGRGSLNLFGKYSAYAQGLEIERGRLLFANGPLDNPGIELRAMRKVRQDKVGIEVRGPALAPSLDLWSEPPMNQAEALSLLVLGQPLSSASSADGAQLGQAAAAMGGNLLAARVGGRLGLDTFGVSDSSSIGAAFTVGKYLSPRLYLAYGVALFEDASAVTVRYLISDRLDLELESSRESRAGINYRVER
ncbi:translocation/assembly module TamB domain-containing protein [Pseudomarimonas arenosa]|uniref:Translocation/assembly module TamB domain-containing protein n=1 Tax=Pseudomarimonas arenosa TaxID=2774145 RepID=A0AAW3ZJU5_9GAMM|nr:translocation/assembly module TamB domain-containing protein [Pseudomarimonas arenosa]MBD8525725.1 translocation/assembly module TamB domain-containing protein [Pseudomarimonas arenosa]